MRTMVALLCALLTGCAASHRACDVSRVPIVFTTPGDPESGEYGGMVVPVAHAGRVGYLAIDTGSALTFLYLGDDGPEYRERVGSVRLGCEEQRLPGRGFSPDDETGIGIVGVLGADFLLSRPAAFDPARALITRHLGGPAPPEFNPDGTTEVPFEDVAGHIIVHVTVDGRELRLMWDTGSPHLLWIGEEGRPGDEEITGEDIEGGRFSMFLGQATLALAGESPREIPALRAPQFPYFEGIVESLGGRIDGLAGQSLFGPRLMIFDTRAGVIRLGPISRPEHGGE